MDESGDTIDHGYMSRYLSDISADEVDLADLLVSTLILLAPWSSIYTAKRICLLWM